MKHIITATKETTYDFETMKKDKQAMFIILPFDDTSYDAVANMLINEILTKTHNLALECHLQTLPYHLTVFYNFNRAFYLPDIQMKMIVGRKRHIDYSINCGCLQLLKDSYPIEWETIPDCCDTLLYLGVDEEDLANYFQNYIPLYINPDKVILKPDRICFVSIRGLDPMCGAKYRADKHPNYPKS
jgi:type IV secretory pathway TraG/TraD family ATPase VirD4